MGVALNLVEDLASSGLSAWTAMLSPVASRSGATITNGGGSLHYTRSDLNVNGSNAFGLEAVVSAEALTANEERGARMWVKFSDTGLLPGDVYWAEVRLVRELGVNKIKLFDAHQGVSLAELSVDWAASAIRVRIKRQQVAGTDYVLLQAEDAGSWDNPASPNNLNDPPRSLAVLLSSFLASMGSSEIGFGNPVAGSYYSDWESVHITRCDTDTDVLPYWPPAPSAPTLALNGASASPHEIQASVDTSAGYHTSDEVSGELTTAIDGPQTAAKAVTGGTVTHVYQSLSDDQSVTGSAIAEEPFGRKTTGADSSPFIIPDLTAPAQPVITSPTSGSETKDQTPTFNGTSEANASVEVFDGATSLGTTTADGSGDWSHTPGASLSEGTHTITVVATDAAGNPSPASTGVEVIIDITAPGQPAITSPTSGTETDDQTPTFIGTAEADASVEVFDGGTSLGTTTADGSGNWSHTPSSNLSETGHTITAVATDAADNSSVASMGVAVTIDITAPLQPAITSPLSGAVTNDQQPVLVGTAEANASVEIFHDTGTGPVSLGTTVVDGSGDWTFTPSINLAETAHTFTVEATDSAGNSSVASADVDVIIDITAPGQPTITSPTSGTETADQTPTFIGTAEADATVEVFDGATSRGTTTADGSGDWTFTPSSNLTESSHNMTVVATDAAGNPSPVSATVVVVVDITPPLPPAIATPDPALYHWTNNQQPPLTGTAEADSTVEVFDGGTSRGTTTADGSGNWTFTPVSNLPVGLHSFTVTSTDAAGNTSSASSPPVDVEIRTALPDGEILVTTDVGVAFISQTWFAPTPGQTFTQPINVGVRVTQDTFDYLDYEFTSNPLVAASSTHQPPSKLMVKLPGSGAFVDFHLDETADFNLHPTGPDWMYVFKEGGVTPRVFAEDGDLELQAFLQDFATNQRTLPAAPPLVLDLDIPPEGVVVLKVSPSTTYAAVTTPILSRPVVPAIRSPHQDVDGATSSITITQNSPTTQSVTVPLGAPTLVAGEYQYEPTNLASFPGGATIDLDGDFTITASIQDSDTPPNTNTLPISASFLLDTSIPSGQCWVSTSYSGTYNPLQPSYSSGPLWVALAIPTSTTDLDEAASTFNVQLTATTGPILLNDAVLSPVVQGSHRLYRWPTEFSTPGLCTIDYQLYDTPVGQTLGLQQCTFTLGQPQFQISSSGVLLSHTASDGSNTDPNNEMLNGAVNNNYMGVRIQNVGSGAGDCAYRLFIVPKYLFSNSADWLLVDEGNPAPVVTAIPDGGAKNSTGNRNFQQSTHPNFPSDVDLFGAGAPVGSIVHTCTAAVLHSPADPLELLDAGGNPVPISVAEFDDPVQFQTAVMDVIQNYNGGGYWAAVQQNPKIANKNFNFKKVV